MIVSAPMVRAILAGRKSQTRCVAAPPMCPAHIHKPYFDSYCDQRKTPENPRGMGVFWNWWKQDGTCFMPKIRCPYGKPGDLLWVKETWRVHGGEEYEYQKLQSSVIYKADAELVYPDYGISYCWRPSIHMPRWASRITLRIKNLRVRRLQDISEADAVSEGIERIQCNGIYERTQDRYKDYTGENWQGLGATGSYESLWESINGRGSWEDNPWVWVIEFERIHNG
jgi:hypothetical protein